MNRKFFTLKTEEGKTNLIIFLVGAVAVLSGIMARTKIGEQWSTVIVSVGASLIASAVVSYITSFYIFKKKRQREVTEVWGLESISDLRSQINHEVTEYFNRSVSELDIIAYGLKSFRDSRSDTFRERLKSGMKVRIITISPDNELLHLKDIDEQKLRGSTANSIQQLLDWCERMERDTNKKVELRFCETLPTEVYFRIDNVVFVGPYQIGRESQHTITMKYSGNTKGFNYYKSYFETLWRNNETTKMN